MLNTIYKESIGTKQCFECCNDDFFEHRALVDFHYYIIILITTVRWVFVPSIELEQNLSVNRPYVSRSGNI